LHTPVGDTVGQLEAYSRDFDSRVDFLVGAPEQARKAAKAYRVYSSKAAGDDEDYLLDHSIVLYLTDANGKFLDFFTQSTPQSEARRSVVGGDVEKERPGVSTQRPRPGPRDGRALFRRRSTSLRPAFGLFASSAAQVVDRICGHYAASK
jgi:hypothetical protein